MIARPRLRQLGLGELLDETFRLYRNNFLDFVAIAALILVPYTIINFAIQLPFQTRLAQFQAQAGNPATFQNQLPVRMLGELAVWYVILIGTGLLYVIVFQPLLQGALARAISQRYLDRPTGIGDSFGAALRRSPALIGSRLIPTLLGSVSFGIVFGLFVAAFVLMLRTAGRGAAQARTSVPLVLLMVGLGFLLLLIASIVVGCVAVRIIFTSQIVMIEGRGPWASLVRSWRLTQRYFWRTLGFVIVIVLLVVLLSSIPTLAIALPVQFFAGQRTYLIVASAVGGILNVIATPFAMIAYTLMYYDLRIRKEGFDLEQQTTAMLLPNSHTPSLLGS